MIDRPFIVQPIPCQSSIRSLRAIAVRRATSVREGTVPENVKKTRTRRGSSSTLWSQTTTGPLINMSAVASGSILRTETPMLGSNYLATANTVALENLFDDLVECV